MKIKDKIEKYLNEQKRDTYYKPKIGTFHASECGKCPRLIFLGKLNPKEPDISSKKIFLIGNLFHEFMQKNILNEYQIEKQIQEKIDNIQIVGRIDAYNSEEIIELKTCSNANYIFKPYKDNIIQINIYMYFTNIHKGRIIYISKNNLDIAEFMINYNKELFENTIRKLKYINQKLLEKADPMNIVPEISIFCYNCKYRNRCFPKQY